MKINYKKVFDLWAANSNLTYKLYSVHLCMNNENFIKITIMYFAAWAVNLKLSFSHIFVHFHYSYIIVLLEMNEIIY